MGNKWVFHIKQNPDGTIAWYKARLVAKGFRQQSAIDFHETFNPVINLITVHTVLSIALTSGKFFNFMSTMTFSMGILQRRSIWRSHKACEMFIIGIMFVVYTRLFMGSNNLHGLGTRCSAPSYSGLNLSLPVQTRPSLFTLMVMHLSISWFMLTI